MRISDWSSDVCSSDLMAQYSERLRDPKWRASPVGRRLGHHEVQYAVSQIGGSGDTACAQGTREFPPADALDQCRQDDGDCAQKTGVVSDDAEKQGSREQASKRPTRPSLQHIPGRPGKQQYEGVVSETGSDQGPGEQDGGVERQVGGRQGQEPQPLERKSVV